MKRSVLLLCFLLCCSFSFARVPRRVSRSADSTYDSALATANKFLHAWQTQDHETGLMMLTDTAREHASRERLQEFFSSGPQAAFEIQRGKRIGTGEYVFPAVLFDEAAPTHKPHACRIVVVRAGKDDWAVDRLP